MSGHCTLTTAQVRHLAASVRRGLADLGDPSIRAPRAQDYRAETHFSPYNQFDFAVDVDVGTTVVTLRTSDDWPLLAALGTGVDLDALADAIVTHVSLTLGDHAGLAHLREVEAKCRRKVKRERSGLDVLSVRFAPGSTNRPQLTWGREVWVRVGMLDDMLLPYIEIVTGQVSRNLKRLGEHQRRRLGALDRLTRDDSMLEIEATAEHAIAAAGRSVGEVARTMLRLRRPNCGSGPTVLLWGDLEGEFVSVVVRNGRIHVEALVSMLQWTWERGIVVHRVFPETLTIALAGRPLRTLVEHRLFHGDAEIAEATQWGPEKTLVRIASDARPIRREELDDAEGPAVQPSEQPDTANMD